MVGRSCRNEMAKKVAKSGVLLVKHDVMDAPSRSIPLNMKKRATPGTKMPTKTKMRLAGVPRSMLSTKSTT